MKKKVIYSLGLTMLVGGLIGEANASNYMLRRAQAKLGATATTPTPTPQTQTMANPLFRTVLPPQQPQQQQQPIVQAAQNDGAAGSVRPGGFLSQFEAGSNYTPSADFGSGLIVLEEVQTNTQTSSSASTYTANKPEVKASGAVLTQTEKVSDWTRSEEVLMPSQQNQTLVPPPSQAQRNQTLIPPQPKAGVEADLQRQVGINRELQLQINDLNGKIENLSAEKQEIDKQLRDIEAKLATYEPEGKKEASYADLLKQLDALSAEKEKLDATNDELNEQVGALNAEKAKLDKRIKELEDENKTLREQNDKLAAELQMEKRFDHNALLAYSKRLPMGANLVCRQFGLVDVDDKVLTNGAATVQDDMATLADKDNGKPFAIAMRIVNAKLEDADKITKESVFLQANANMYKIQTSLNTLKGEVEKKDGLRDQLAKTISDKGNLGKRQDNVARVAITNKVGEFLATQKDLELNEHALGILCNNIMFHAIKNGGVNIAGGNVDQFVKAKAYNANSLAKAIVDAIFENTKAWVFYIHAANAINNCAIKVLEKGGFDALSSDKMRKSAVFSIARLGRIGNGLNGFDFTTGKIGGVQNATVTAGWKKLDDLNKNNAAAVRQDSGLWTREALGLDKKIEGVLDVAPEPRERFLKLSCGSGYLTGK